MAFSYGLLDSFSHVSQDVISIRAVETQVWAKELQTELAFQEELGEWEPTLLSVPSTIFGGETSMLLIDLKSSRGWVSVPSSLFNAFSGCEEGPSLSIITKKVVSSFFLWEDE